MKVDLTSEELKMRKEIEARLNTLHKYFRESHISDKQAEVILHEMGAFAHKLHASLKNRAIEPRHHKYMMKNRNLKPDDPEFYMHVHPVEDLIDFLDDQFVNDDPKDATIGHSFEFRVYSNRWGHDDIYRVKRIPDGWYVRNMTIGGPCDSGGDPFLFDSLKHDLIEYPINLRFYMESLWKKAKEKGLTHEKVQEGLQNLADWISITEKATPSTGIWK
jgi:hypothetical protein